MKVDSIDCKIKTPAGSFTCYKYFINYKTKFNMIWNIYYINFNSIFIT